MTKAASAASKTTRKKQGRKKSAKSAARARTALMVLGMHRSGTSALAGVLHLMGCDMPKNQMVPNADNPKGFFESNQIYAMHTKLLASAGSRWDDWLPINDSWYGCVRADEYQEQALSLLDSEFGKSRLFVLKDPRICRLVPFWDDVLQETKITPQYVLTHRNPVEVARSLSGRDGMDENIAMLIWLRHVLDAEASTRGRPRCFVSYDMLMSNWAGVISHIETTLDLTLPRFTPGTAAEVEAFLDRGLRHQNHATRQVLDNPMFSQWVRTAYGIMENWATDKEHKTDYETLDALRANLDSAASTFGPALEAGITRAKNDSARISTIEAEREKLDQSLTETRNARDKAERHATQAGQKNAVLRSEMEQLTRDHAAEKEARLGVEQQRDEMKVWLKRNETSSEKLRVSLTETGNARNKAEKHATQAGQKNAVLRAEMEQLTRDHAAEKEARLDVEQQRDEMKVWLKRNETSSEKLRVSLAQSDAKAKDLQAAMEDAQAQITTLTEQRDKATQAQTAAEQGRTAAQDALIQTTDDLNAMSRTAAKAKDALAQAQAELEKATTAHHAAEHRCEEMKVWLLRSETTSEKLRSTITSTKDKIASLTLAHGGAIAAHLQVEQERNALQDKLQNLQDELSKTQSALEQRSHEAEQTHRMLAERNDEIEQTRRMLEQRSREAEQTQRTLTERTLEITRTNNTLTTLQAAQTERERQMAEVKTQLAQVQAERDHEARQVTTLNQQLGEQTSKLATVEGKLSTQYREMADLTGILRDDTARSAAELAALKEQHAQAAADAAMLRRSTSWRITGPLRKIVGILRRD